VTPPARDIRVPAADLHGHQAAVPAVPAAAAVTCGGTARGPHGVINGARTQHDYRWCQDEDCQRFACRVYKEGYRRGHDTGYALGYAEGYAAGEAAGYQAGYAAGAATAAKG
jgi:hypothetical protein